MPPKAKVTRDEIVNAAVTLVRREGASALNARAIARQLQVSTQPIFSNFSTMEALKREVIARAEEIFRQFLLEHLEKKVYPPYKISGMCYINFARQERELFKLLYMRDRGGVDQKVSTHDPMIGMIRRGTGLSAELAERLHGEMWFFVHGIAVAIATDYLTPDEETVSAMLTDVYQSLKVRFCAKENINEEHH